MCWVNAKPQPTYCIAILMKAVSKGHGRLEIRDCWVIADPLAFDYIRHYEGWADLSAIVRVKHERRLADKVQQETAY
jgi:hypothetical protein